MPILTELSSAIKRQRSDMGLSQERLAVLAGLSRTTINELETGKLGNLSLARAERLANLLGFGIGITGVKTPKPGRDAGSVFDTAARTASVSYSDPIPPDTLRHAMLTGVISPGYIAQLRSFLDEAPISVISSAVAELELDTGTARKAIWQKLRQLAATLACTRDLWS